ncbi:MAG: hypothetical protein LBC52_01575 [Treponema sp.]|jgi:hypothetical protein|nr:hypothetical protein [Treponema sp.]
MSGSGRGGDSRGPHKKPFKRRDNQPQNRDSPKSGKKTVDLAMDSGGKFEKKRGSFVERPKWVPPKPPVLSLPPAVCAWCGKPIKELSTAISEPGSGKPVHFDCAISKIVEEETLERGDTVSYIGGGRFGIIHYNNPPDIRDFKIRKVLEWENKETRSEWRVAISEYFTIT